MSEEEREQEPIMAFEAVQIWYSIILHLHILLPKDLLKSYDKSS